jgi:hypothetical protein
MLVIVLASVNIGYLLVLEGLCERFVLQGGTSYYLRLITPIQLLHPI